MTDIKIIDVRAQIKRSKKEKKKKKLCFTWFFIDVVTYSMFAFSPKKIKVTPRLLRKTNPKVVQLKEMVHSTQLSLTACKLVYTKGQSNFLFYSIFPIMIQWS